MTQATDRIFCGDCRQVMQDLPAGSVHCCVTSPPYYGLRRYEGVGASVWGGDVRCEHVWGDSPGRTLRGPVGGRSTLDGGDQDAGARRIERIEAGAHCPRCGAWRGCLGLEPTFDGYVANLLEVFGTKHNPVGVWRLLRDDGTLWLNIGDAHASGKGTCHNPGGGESSLGKEKKEAGVLPLDRGSITGLRGQGLKSKDLMGMPWRVAFALQAGGWYIRSAIVWAKGISFNSAWSGSVMPESVNGWRWERCRKKSGLRVPSKTPSGWNVNHDQPDDKGRYEDQKWQNEWSDCPGCDKCRATGGYVLRKGAWRPTSAYEMVFLLAKSERYYCDVEQVREAAVAESANRYLKPFFKGKKEAGTAQRPDGKRNTGHNLHFRGTRNPRNVWGIGTQACRDDHYAAYTERLVEPCVKAGTPEQVCGQCGSPWAPIIDYPADYQRFKHQERQRRGEMRNSDRRKDGSTKGKANASVSARRQVTGYRPTCECDVDAGPAVVFDPFCGTGTTLAVALKMGREAIGIDASPKYCEMAHRRMDGILAGLMAKAEGC